MSLYQSCFPVKTSFVIHLYSFVMVYCFKTDAIIPFPVSSAVILFVWLREYCGHISQRLILFVYGQI